MSLIDILRQWVASLGESASDTDESPPPDDTDATDTDTDTDESDTGEATTPPPGDDTDPESLTRQIEALEAQLSDVQENLTGVENNIETLTNQHDSTATRLDDVEDNLDTVLGIYDVIVEQHNPLAGPASPTGDLNADALTNTDTDTDTDATTTDSPFNAFEQPTTDNATAVDESGTDNSLFQADNTSETETASDDTPADTTADETPAHGTDAPDGEAAETTLPFLPHGTASELLVFEWLHMLLDAVGTAGTLNALRYYDRIGWISTQTRYALERRVLGIAHTTPETTSHYATTADTATETAASELAGEPDHTRSLEYILMLAYNSPTLDAQSRVRDRSVGDAHHE